MKKIYFLFLFLLSLNTVFAAKESSPSELPFGEGEVLSMGPLLGGNVGNMVFDPKPTTTASSRFGGMTGGFMEVHLTGPVFLYTEFSFVQHGYRIGSSLLFADDYNYDYFDFPLLLKLKFGLGERKRVHLFGVVGPTLGFLLKAESKDGSTVLADLDPTTESLNVAINLGGGAEVWLAQKFALVGNLRFMVGLTDIDKTANKMRTIDIQSFVAAKFAF